jgi:hypothetical protein
MPIVTAYAFQLLAEKKICCRILHHVAWYKINFAKENSASVFSTLNIKVKLELKVTP